MIAHHVSKAVQLHRNPVQDRGNVGTLSATDQQAGVLRRAITASAMGNAVEWFDYGVYSFVVAYVSAAFFPGVSPAVQLLSGFGVFAVSFLIRPIGGLVLGPLGDRLGRKRILAITIVLMSASTFCVGLIPGYATIGVWAPVLLITLRMIQGFSTGGEYGGAATFMAEYAPDRRRGFLGSFLEFGTLTGYILGAGVVTILTATLGETAMADWGWRVPFLIAGPLGIVGLYLRTRLEDTPVFTAMLKTGSTENAGTQTRTLLAHWRPILVLMGLVTLLNIANYTLLSYMPTYLQRRLDLGGQGSLVITIIVYLAMMAVIPFIGRLSDRIGRKPLWYFSAIGLFVFSIPAYAVMGNGWVLTVVGFVVLGLLFVPQLATISATFPALFPASIRYAAFAIGYNIATSLFGGTAPLVQEWLGEVTGNRLSPAFYLMAACVVGLVALRFTPETAGKSLEETGSITQLEQDRHP